MLVDSVLWMRIFLISQTWIFRGFSLFIINLARRQLYRDGQRREGGGMTGGGGACSGLFCVLLSLKRWVRSAHGRGVRSKPTSDLMFDL
jgi:hypothetical protein